MTNLMEEQDSSDFVVLTDVIPAIVLEMRYFSSFNFTGQRVKDYLEPIALLTKEAAFKLKNASNVFRKKDLILKIYDAYRPQTSVDSFIQWTKTGSDIMKPYFYPKLTRDEIFSLGYLFKKSSHSRGSAVDITLIDIKTGRSLDMGGPYDYFDEISHPSYKNITKVQFDNRMLLGETMMNNGFIPTKTEWWHFSLKDEPFPDKYFSFPVTGASLKNKTYKGT